MTTKDVWNTYQYDLQQFIISKVKDTTIADDILQETFLKIHTKLHTLKDITKLKSWIFTIARNCIMDYFKRSNMSTELKWIEAEEMPTIPEHTEKDCLHGILNTLPKKYREPLFLSDIKGIKQSVIAKQLDVPLPTIKSQIQRARKKIIQGFIDCCGFEVNEHGYLVGEVQDKDDCKVCK